MKGSVILIGISGTTNSGKTTLVRRLVQRFPGSHSVCQDHYFMPPGDKRLAPLYLPELDHHNWEDHRALEMDRMVEELKTKVATIEKEHKHSPVFVFIDGFSIFGWRPLCSMFHRKYFLTVSKEVCQSRRLGRNYNPPDVPGYFEQIVWPMHEKHLETIKSQTDIVYMDCDQSSEELYERICSDIQSYL